MLKKWFHLFNSKKLRDKAYLLDNIPDDVELAAWKVIVRLSTLNNKKVSEKFVYEQLDRLDKHRINRNEQKYIKLGQNLEDVDEDLLDRHLNYVKGLFEYEKKRQENIEKKALQLISQSSIIISIITLVIGVLAGDLSSLSNGWVYTLVILFAFVLLLLFLTICFSVLSLHTRLFSRPSHTLLTTGEARKVKNFIYRETCTLYDNVEHNIAIDDKKAAQMNNGYKFFHLSILIIVIFSVFILSAVFRLEKTKIDSLNNSTKSSEITLISNGLAKISNELKNIKTEISVSEKKETNQYYITSNSHSISPLVFFLTLMFIALLIYLTLSIPYFKINYKVRLLTSLTLSSLITCTFKFAFDFNFSYDPPPINITNKYCCDTLESKLSELDSIGVVGPFVTGTIRLQNPNNALFLSLAEALKKNKYKEIYVFGGVDKRQLKGYVAKLFGDNLSLSQARANMVKDSLKHYLKGSYKLTIFTYLSGANYYGKDSIGYSNDRYVKIYAK